MKRSTNRKQSAEKGEVRTARSAKRFDTAQDVPLSTTRFVRYVLMDIVGFSANRTVEAQSDIIAILNRVVRKATHTLVSSRNKVLFLPTGDGICVAILDPLLPYDIHVQLAVGVLQRLYTHNQAITDDMRKFQVRLGVNENVDNLITDINGSSNIAGAGINSTQRILGFADGGQILVGQTVFETLTHREAFKGAFRSYQAVAKHSVRLPIHQLILPKADWLNSTPPQSLAPPARAVPRLSVREAYLFAHAIRNQEFFRSVDPRGQARAALTVLLYYLATDSEQLSEKVLGEVPSIHAYGHGKLSVAEQLKYYMAADFQLCFDLATHIWNGLYHLAPYFEGSYGFVCFINSRGREKLRSEHPKIWTEMQLGDI